MWAAPPWSCANAKAQGQICNNTLASNGIVTANIPVDHFRAFRGGTDRRLVCTAQHEQTSARRCTTGCISPGPTITSPCARFLYRRPGPLSSAAAGELYQVDSYSYGLSANTVVVVESTGGGQLPWCATARRIIMNSNLSPIAAAAITVRPCWLWAYRILATRRHGHCHGGFHRRGHYELLVLLQRSLPDLPVLQRGHGNSGSDPGADPLLPKHSYQLHYQQQARSRSGARGRDRASTATTSHTARRGPRITGGATCMAHCASPTATPMGTMKTVPSFPQRHSMPASGRADHLQDRYLSG